MNENVKTEAARALLSTGAVFFRPEEPFLWASGIESPVYCDNRLILTDTEARKVIEEGLMELIREEYPEAEALFGTATAGIPHAAIAGYEMELPMGYVRSSAKDHGRKSRIEGRTIPGQKVVVVEDLVSTGGSVIEAAKALREEGLQVLGIACLFTYNLNRAREAFAREKFAWRALTDFDTVAKEAARTGYVREEELETLMEFRDRL